MIELDPPILEALAQRCLPEFSPEEGRQRIRVLLDHLTNEYLRLARIEHVQLTRQEEMK